MKITLDIKTFVIGFLAGVLFICALGVAGRGGDFASFGVAVPSGGSVLVKTEKERAYLVDGATGRAVPVNFADTTRETKLY